MFRHRGKTKKAVDTVTETVTDRIDETSTNPAVPVAGALGFTMLGAGLLRRRRRKSTPTGNSAGER